MWVRRPQPFWDEGLSSLMAEKLGMCGVLCLLLRLDSCSMIMCIRWVSSVVFLVIELMLSCIMLMLFSVVMGCVWKSWLV